MGTAGLPGGPCLLSLCLTWRTQLGPARWSRRANRGHVRDVCGRRDKDKVMARGQSRYCPGPHMAQEDRGTLP